MLDCWGRWRGCRVSKEKWIPFDVDSFPDFVDELFAAGKKENGDWEIYRFSEMPKSSVRKSFELLERYDGVKITHWMPIEPPDPPEE